MLTFEASQHVYHWQGKRVPSVTQVLQPLSPDFAKMDPEVLERARNEGIAQHRMVELACKNDLGPLPTWLEPYFAGWRKFVDETGFEFLTSEERVYHPMYGYAGTLDLSGKFPSGYCIIDLKRSFAAGAVVGLQLAAYKECIAAQLKQWKSAQRWALRLNADGTYNMRQFSDEDDFGVFLALLKIQRYREKHSIKES